MPADLRDFDVVSHDDAEGFEPVDSRLTELDVEAIRQWLAPTDYDGPSSEYTRHLASQAPDTGLWVRSTSQYAQWHDTDANGAIWVKAVAGAGKSVLAASVVDHLKSTEPDAVVCFFFFRHIVEANKGPRALLRDLLAQLLRASPVLKSSLHAFLQSRDSVDLASTTQLWHLLLAGLRDVPRVYLVIDGLDEMTASDDEESDFLDSLNTLGSVKPASVKVMLTSRPEQHLQHALRDPKLIHVDLERDLVNSDIALFVQHRMRSWNLDAVTRQLLLDTLLARAKGLFLYARLMLDQLQERNSTTPLPASAIQSLISQLPVGLEDMYNTMLSEHASKARVTQQFQVDVFDFVTHAARPMRLLELAAALQLLQGDSGASLDYKSLIRSACGPLIEVMENGTVQVLHHSLTEFLHAERPQQTEAAVPQFPRLDAPSSHNKIAAVCLKHVSSGVLAPKNAYIDPSSLEDIRRNCSSDQPLGANLYRYRPRYTSPYMVAPEQVDFQPSKLFLQHPLLYYACVNWPFHVRSASVFMPEHFLVLDGFLQPDSLTLYYWILSRDVEPTAHALETGTPTLTIAANLGLSPYVKYLLNKGEQANAQDLHSATPLHHASLAGHADLVSLLLEHGADKDALDSANCKPLDLASRYGHVEVARVFLSLGMSPESSSLFPSDIALQSRYWPLTHAVRAGHRSMVAAMLPMCSKTALQWALSNASERGYPEIVRDVLAMPDVDPNAYSLALGPDPPLRETPLSLAAWALSPDTVAALLDAGADVNKLSDGIDLDDVKHLSLTPLHTWAFMDSGSRQEYAGDVFRLLVKAGGDVNVKTADGRTALLMSQSRRYKSDSPVPHELAQLLLEAGADPNCCEENGQSALHLAISHKTQDNGPSAIKLLCKHGVDPNVRCNLQRTPLHYAALQTSSTNIRLLLESGALIDAKDSRGATPLILATWGFAEDTVKELLSHGADINACDQDGRTALFYASTRLADVLIENGASQEVVDNKGRTPFLQAIVAADEETAFKYVDAGASLTVRDLEGKTALHLCAGLHYSFKYQRPVLFKALMDRGVDVMQT